MQTSLLQRWRSSRTARPGLDTLLVPPAAGAPLEERVRWLEELATFIRTPPRAPAGGRAQTPVNRFRGLLALLERKPAHAEGVREVLASLLADLDAVELFSGSGLTSDMGLAAELSERLWRKVLPAHREPRDFGDLVHRLAPALDAAAWLLELTAEDVARAKALLDVAGSGWQRDLCDALALLAAKARVIAAYEELRLRLPSRRLTETAFFDLDAAARALQMCDGALGLHELEAVKAAVERCAGELKLLEESLRAHGSSFALTYQVNRLGAIVARIDALTTYLLRVGGDPLATPRLCARLAAEAAQRHELRPLWSEVSRTIAHRVADANADVGDHYIARNRGEYWHVVGAALGGGVVTVATVFGKLVAEHSALPSLAKGLAAAAVYALSFLVIQALGWTLATKQPAMTAATLARTLDGPEGPGRIVAFAKELVHLVRTQLATIVGNVAGVVAGIAVVTIMFTRLTGSAPLTPDEAHQLLAGHSVLGPTPLFAAYTGVALWLSSIVAGWTSNLLRMRRVADAIAGHRRCRVAFGDGRARRLGALVEQGMPAALSNGALGLLLGFVPRVVQAFGLPLEARHITLSCGAVALGLLSGGAHAMTTGELAALGAGLVAIGALNLGVSFAVAIAVALRSRQVAPAQSRMIRRAIVAQLVKRPLALLVPGRQEA